MPFGKNHTYIFLTRIFFSNTQFILISFYASPTQQINLQLPQLSEGIILTV